MTSRRALVLLLALPIALAACGGAAATPTPIPTPTPTATVAPATSPPAGSPAPAAAGSPAASATPAASGSPAGSPGPAASASPIAFHVDPFLEAQLPVLVEGQKVAVETLPVSSYLQLMDPTSDAAHSLRRFLTEVGSDPAAITVAFASYGADEDLVEFQAYRAPRARPDHLLAATVYLMRSATGDPAAATVATVQVGNRTVTRITGAGDTPAVIHVFVEGEVAVVSGASETQVAALLDALP
jgi:hypothetical protein